MVTLVGSGFGAIQSTGTLSYNGVTIQPTTWSETAITVVIPSTAQGNGSFVVTAGGHSSAPSVQFALSAPMLYSINPAQGNPGTQVTLSGLYFGAQQGSSYVAFNAQQAQIISWSASQIVCLVPTGSQITGTVAVTVNVNGTAATGAHQFTVSVPTIYTVQPAIDNIGAAVTISGQGFGASQAQSQVTIGGISCFVRSWSETSIQITVPQGLQAGVRNVVVTVNGQPSTAGTMTIAAPQLSSYFPNQPGNGNAFQLNGSHFGQTQAEGNGQIHLLSETSGLQTVSGASWSDSSIQFTWPVSNRTLGTQQVTVTVTVGGLSSSYTLTAD